VFRSEETPNNRRGGPRPGLLWRLPEMIHRQTVQRVPFLAWHSEARLVSSSIAAYNGPLLECVRRWQRLPLLDRARAFVLIEGAEAKILKPSELRQIVSGPEYLSL